MSDEEFDKYFIKDKLILFVFYGYEILICMIFFDCYNYYLMIYGYKENGDIMILFDMCVVNEFDCYYLVKDVVLKIKGS